MFTVDSTIDEPDANSGDGLCASAPSGECTLRAAIEEANVLPGIDNITFASEITGTIYLTSALPGLVESVTIVGPGPELLSLATQ
ncbi:MAG: CSLREA domain-containing protein, partial [Acidobacteria bacterium]|nr:CSLREA domain-containing protein [Acidobacteriota bacterium]